MSGIAPFWNAHKLDKLRAWLGSVRPDWANLTVSPRDTVLKTGFSAQIYFVDVTYVDSLGAQSRMLVVRCQPRDLEVVLGASLELQGKMMDALNRRRVVRVPEWIGMDTEGEILGVPFLVMEKVEGRAASQRPSYNVSGWLAELDPAARAKTFRNGIEAFAPLAQIDWRRDGFAFLARPQWGEPGLDQYLGHLEAWHAGCAKGRAMPYVDAALRFMRDKQPRDTSVNVLWGDCNPANVMFAEDGSVNALLDWELAELGPADLDLVWWLYADDMWSRRFGVARLKGLPTREETIDIWQNATGREARHLEYYEVVAGLRMALVMVGAFDREVGHGHVPAHNETLNKNIATTYLAERLGMDVPVLGEDYVAFMSNFK
jgi:aminoglycoside phosphotransferase (APT) family kinase protein